MYLKIQRSRNWTIENFGYGPMNPDMPNEEFWQKKAEIFDTNIEEAMSTRCGNCAAFDQSCSMIDCIAKGINEEGTTANPMQVIQLGNVGYCQLFKFKCAGDRTCDAWVTWWSYQRRQNEKDGYGFSRARS